MTGRRRDVGDRPRKGLPIDRPIDTADEPDRRALRDYLDEAGLPKVDPPESPDAETT